MFSSSPKNPYTELIASATNEKQTSEDWGTLLAIWEKVNAEGETGARNAVLAIVQRLQHRNANVQLFSLTLANALVKNCGKALHHEIASKTFTESLKRLASDRNTHQKVKQRVLGLIREWTSEFERDDSLGIMADAYDALKAKGLSFEEPQDEGPAPVSDAVLKKEEEDLQKAIAESEREAQQVRGSSNGYQPATTASRPQTSTSQKLLPVVSPATTAVAPYPSLQTSTLQQQHSTHVESTSQPKVGIVTTAPTRARALYDFDPDPEQPGELPLRRGDVVRILDSAYQEWWRGEINGRIGIFPVTYVEVIPEATPEMILADAQYEANLFAQAGDVDRLLQMLQSVDPARENVGDNDELSDLYQKCLMLRPKVLKMVEKYTNKKNELLDINQRFMSAKTEYESMIEDTWKRHQAASEHPPHTAYHQPGYAPPFAQQYSHVPPTALAAPQHLHGHPPMTDSHAALQSMNPSAPTAQGGEQSYSATTNQPQPFYDETSRQWWYPPNSFGATAVHSLPAETPPAQAHVQ